MKEKTEGVVRESLNDMNVWFQKLQNIHVVTTPADFLVLTEKYRYLIEVKEVKLFLGHKIFSFDRLTQERDLINFHKQFNMNRSAIILNFRDKTLKRSHIYFIPIERYLSMKQDIGKKSINIGQMDRYFNQYKIGILPGSKLNLSEYLT